MLVDSSIIFLQGSVVSHLRRIKRIGYISLADGPDSYDSVQSVPSSPDAGRLASKAGLPCCFFA